MSCGTATKNRWRPSPSRMAWPRFSSWFPVPINTLMKTPPGCWPRMRPGVLAWQPLCITCWKASVCQASCLSPICRNPLRRSWTSAVPLRMSAPGNPLPPLAGCMPVQRCRRARCCSPVLIWKRNWPSWKPTLPPRRSRRRRAFPPRRRSPSPILKR